MSPARSWRSSSHAAGSLTGFTGGPGLRRGGIGGYNLQSHLTVTHQLRAGCIRLVRLHTRHTRHPNRYSLRKVGLLLHPQ